MSILVATGAATLLASSCVRYSTDKQTHRLLTQLDGYVSAREMYDVKKRDQLEAIARLVSTATDPEHRYEAGMSLASEYFAYSFDSTQACLKRCMALAQDVLKDKERYDRSSIMLGSLYGKAGNYMEARSILYDQIDSSVLSDDLKAEYFWTLYDFSRDLSGNSGMVDRLAIPDKGVYRERLYSLLPRDSERWRLLRMQQLSEEGRLESADSLGRILLSGLSQEDRRYAIYAFEVSDIADRQGQDFQRLEWLVKSSQCDIINGIKDYASLTMVAQIILSQDIDRSFRYLRIAQEDAIFYNARLRPWQISHSLMEVEGAYQKRQAFTSRLLLGALILLALLLAVLSILYHFLIVRSRKLTKARIDLEESNAQLAQNNITLNELNSRISQADQVKEEYIIGFLEGLADQISTVRAEDNRYRNLLKQGKAEQMLKELSVSSRSEKARDDFYKTFDHTFLAMYPRFVEQFNSLLQEDARINPPKGRLNTELRIFALIRLGVDDSKKIASMLDYSVSTIYNYKVSIKNAALGDRDKFEERVKSIGK